MAKLLTIVGATGKQGGALVDSILAHPTFSKTFTLRGVTRDASKAAAVALQRRGVEVVEVCAPATQKQRMSSLNADIAGRHGRL
jgi:N-acetyl-gamma-glutamylphosphate reductase